MSGRATAIERPEQETVNETGKKGMIGRSGPLLFMIPPKAAFGKNVFQHKNKFAHICLRDRLLPFPMRKILPETVFLLSGILQQLAAQFSRQQGGAYLPLEGDSRAASTVIYHASETRMPVAQMASKSRERRSRPWARAASSRYFSNVPVPRSSARK
ncbi:MAG: hypothetical protein KH195_12625 [Clostridiaceae bacterium]|nr:hypothetical protein [Clostridiaceae bacterium]